MPNTACLTPYVRLPVRKIRTQIPGPGRCCGATTRNPYCGVCGKPVAPEMVDKEVCSVEYPGQVQAELDDALSFVADRPWDGYHYWRPNAPRGLPDQPSTDLPSGSMTPVTPEGVASAIALFQQRYAAEIDGLADLYKEPAEVGFGFLVEYD